MSIPRQLRLREQLALEPRRGRFRVWGGLDCSPCWSCPPPGPCSPRPVPSLAGLATYPATSSGQGLLGCDAHLLVLGQGPPEAGRLGTVLSFPGRGSLNGAGAGAQRWPWWPTGGLLDAIGVKPHCPHPGPCAAAALPTAGSRRASASPGSLPGAPACALSPQAGTWPSETSTQGRWSRATISATGPCCSQSPQAFKS